MTMQLVSQTVHDENIIMTRRLRQTEQFRDERTRDLATKHFLTGIAEINTHIFSEMMDKGPLVRDDPGILAFACTIPIPRSFIYMTGNRKIPEVMSRVEVVSRDDIRMHGRTRQGKYSGLVWPDS